MLQGERLNGYSHLLGTVLAVAGTVALLIKAGMGGDGWKIVSTCIYAGTLLLLYLSSTLYHGLGKGAAKSIFLKLDHLAIYLLIAGTYTPFTLITLRGAWGWTLFGIVWGLAVAGIILDLFHH